MALVVETGTGVTGADSYATLEEVKSFASSRGASLPSNDTAIEALARRATEFLETLRGRYLGTWLYGPGYLQWPRNDVFIDGFAVETDAIPQSLKDAQCQLVIELQTLDPLASSPAGMAVQSETISTGTISTTYAAGQAPVLPTMPKVMGMLAPLFRKGVAVTRV